MDWPSLNGLLLGFFKNFKPLTPWSDWHLTSPANNTPKSKIEVMTMKEMITLAAPWEIYGEQYEENVY